MRTRKRAGLSRRSLDSFKRQLLRRREEVIKDLRRRLDRRKLSAEEDGLDNADIAANEMEAQMLVALSEADCRELEQIEAALERIEAGDYGVCEDCGKPIGRERLRALPYVTLCLECKRRREDMGEDGFNETDSKAGSRLGRLWDTVDGSQESDAAPLVEVDSTVVLEPV